MDTKVETLKKLFDAEIVTSEPYKEKVDFIEERSNIERQMPDHFSIQQFMEKLALLKTYGLEDVMLKRVEHEIWYLASYKPVEFYNSDFYQRYRDEKVVKKHFDESQIEKSN